MADGCTGRDWGEQGSKATWACSRLRRQGHLGTQVLQCACRLPDTAVGLLEGADGSRNSRHCIATKKPDISHQGLRAVQHIVPGALVLTNAVGRANTVQTDQGRACGSSQGAAGGNTGHLRQAVALLIALNSQRPDRVRLENDEHCFSAPVGEAVLRVTVGEGYTNSSCLAAQRPPPLQEAVLRLVCSPENGRQQCDPGMTHACSAMPALPCLLCHACSAPLGCRPVHSGRLEEPPPLCTGMRPSAVLLQVRCGCHAALSPSHGTLQQIAASACPHRGLLILEGCGLSSAACLPLAALGGF